jgi:hypothetical protein
LDENIRYTGVGEHTTQAPQRTDVNDEDVTPLKHHPEATPVEMPRIDAKQLFVSSLFLVCLAHRSN